MSTTPAEATVARRVAAHHDVDDVDPAAIRALAIYERARNADRAPSGPTRTKTIQDDYAAEMFKRFRRLKGLVLETIAENDALGLGDGDSRPGRIDLEAQNARFDAQQSSPTRSYDFPSDGEKVDAFLDDLRRWADREVLEVRRRDASGRVVDREAWQNVYVRRSYGRGVQFADARLREQGIDVPEEELAAIFAAPTHADALGILYTRDFRELEGVTDAMAQTISRELTQGFAEGVNPREMARRINGRVDAIGLTRARTLARTEVIHAHSEATLNRYESILGPDAKVTGKAEWLTAGDQRVCPRCAGLEGTVRSVADARGLIPLHPNCRCAWIPVVESSRNATAS